MSIDLLLASSTTTMRLSTGDEMTLDVGTESLRSTCFRHDPPHPVEIEHAIQVVEDALMKAQISCKPGNELRTSSPSLLWLFTASKISSLSTEVVEDLFQRLALVSQGRSSALLALPAGGEAAASLIILRELMHHLSLTMVKGEGMP